MRPIYQFAALTLGSLAVLAGCGLAGTDNQQGEATEVVASAPANLADSMASDDAAGRRSGGADPHPVMQMQVVLERLGFGPGVIGDTISAATVNALKGFQEAHGLPVTGEVDAATAKALAQWSQIPSTRTVTIPQAWAQDSYAAMPAKAAEQAKLKHLGYESLEERLAERFHTSVDMLRALNAGAADAANSAPVVLTPGQKIVVPNVGADRIESGAIKNQEWQASMASLGVGSAQPAAARILVDESAGWLKVYDKADRLVATFTVTTGSRHDPLPLGEWGVKGVSHNPPFAYDPDLFWDVSDSVADQQLPPGPNGPVGVVWIDLEKDHYGIHGTPHPETIGTAESHGCVRLTNWDAARLAEMIRGETKAVFQA